MGSKLSKFSGQERQVSDMSSSTNHQFISQECQQEDNIQNHAFFGDIPYYPQNQMNNPEIRGSGFVLAKSSSGINRGTAFLINPKAFITAAHVVCNKQDKKTCKEIIFYRKQNENLVHSYKVDRVYTCPQYIQTKKAKFDFAICILKNEVNTNLFLQIGYNFDDITRKMTLVGYPGDRIIKTKLNEENYSGTLIGLQKQNSITSINYNNGIIYHNITSFQGLSGGSLTVLDQQNQRIIIGIHKGSSKSTQQNVGLIFNNFIIRNLKQIQKEFQTENPGIKLFQYKYCNSPFRWNPQNLEHYQLKGNTITRITKFEQTSPIKSNPIYSSAPIPFEGNYTLKFNNFNYPNNECSIYFGLISQSTKNKKVKIEYRSIYSHNSGMIVIGGKIIVQNKAFFISPNEQLLMTVNMQKYILKLKKNEQQFQMDLRQYIISDIETDFYVYAIMNDYGDSMTVQNIGYSLI